MVAAASTFPSHTTLGIRAKSLHTPKGKERKQSARPAIEGREIRYSLQRVAQDILKSVDKGTTGNGTRKLHRTCGCCRNVQSDGVSIWRTTDGMDARFGNLITCGNVWTCPVCASKITEKRRAELQEGINAAVAAGGSIALMTLTFSHGLGDDLEKSLEQFTKAVTGFKNSRAYGRMKALYGIEFQRTKGSETIDVQGGAVRSMEVTHGLNGWHPHTHDLMFLRNDGLLKDARLIDELKSEWVKQCLKHDLGDSTKISDMFGYGLDIQGGDYAADYVAKFGREPKLIQEWSAAREVTKGISKIGGGSHYTPFMLLEWARAGDQQAAELFREYARVFDGKRMLTWSPGLKAHLLGEDEELTDEEIAQADDPKPEEEVVYRLSEEEWKLVLEKNARYQLLLFAAKHGREGVEAILADLPNMKTTHSGHFQPWARRRFLH